MEELRERVEAVERALTDGESDLTALAEGAVAADRVDSLAADLEALEDDVAELQAATKALRGYVGNVRSVNESVEERADGAVAAVEKLERRIETLERAREDDPGRGQGRRVAGQSQTARDDREGRSDGAGVCRSCGRPEAGTREPQTGPRTESDPQSSRGGTGRSESRSESRNGSRGGPRSGSRSDRRTGAPGGERAGAESDGGRGQPAAGRSGGRRRKNGAAPGFLQRVRERL